jgi:hypothetical protein
LQQFKFVSIEQQPAMTMFDKQQKFETPDWFVKVLPLFGLMMRLFDVDCELTLSSADCAIRPFSINQRTSVVVDADDYVTRRTLRHDPFFAKAA